MNTGILCACRPKSTSWRFISDRLLNAYLMVGTPIVFAEYSRYCEFLEAVSDRTGVHTRNLYVRRKLPHWF